MYLPPSDKVLHVVSGGLAALAGLLIGWLYAVAFCITAALLRELYNRQHGGKFDWRDILATLIGGCLVIASAAVGTDGVSHHQWM